MGKAHFYFTLSGHGKLEVEEVNIIRGVLHFGGKTSTQFIETVEVAAAALTNFIT